MKKHDSSQINSQLLSLMYGIRRNTNLDIVEHQSVRPYIMYLDSVRHNLRSIYNSLKLKTRNGVLMRMQLS